MATPAQTKTTLTPPPKFSEKMVERVVVGPKRLYYTDAETNETRTHEIGDTCTIPERTAIAFAAYLEDPKLHSARAKVAELEADE